jgi:hypothetical protein
MTRKIELAMISAVREVMADPGFSGCYWKSGNTLVFQTQHGIHHTVGYDRTIEVILHDTVVALIEPTMQRVSLYAGGWETVTTRSRINALLREFCPGWSMNRRKGQTVMLDRWDHAEPFREGFGLNFDPWAPLRESRWRDKLSS